MTTLRNPSGCSAGSEASRTEICPASYAFVVNLHNGNVNRNHHDNHYSVRAVRAGEFHDAVSLHSLHTAWRAARRGKKPSVDQLNFDSRWLDGLIDLQERLAAHTWSPGPSTCFIASQPKAREIHAPAFSDRVVHHWLIPQLDAIYEPRFIHDSYSNRTEKGTHAAVRRLTDFVHQVQSGQGGGWYLQLDIANFFNSIHRPTLYAMLKERMTRHGLPEAAKRATHALLKSSPISQGVRYACTAAERSSVPEHKRLANAAPGCGIAIGNLSSQFFANVYLDALDQFVKHELQAQRYLRYVDDFVLVHHSREQLLEWQQRIATFLCDRLRLELKADIRLRPLAAGIDFLGYVIWPTHTVVRRRVISHCRQKLAAWHRHGDRSARSREQLRSIVASYSGHFRHARSWRLVRSIHDRFPWLKAALAKENAV